MIFRFDRSEKFDGNFHKGMVEVMIMFKTRRKKRRLNKRLKELQAQASENLKSRPAFELDDELKSTVKYIVSEMGETEMTPPSEMDDAELTERIKLVSSEVDRLEKTPLFKQAEKYGIEIKEEWIDDIQTGTLERAVFQAGFGYIRLNYFGSINLRAAIKQKKRENIEWWLNKLLIPILVTVGSFVGALVGAWVSLKK